MSKVEELSQNRYPTMAEKYAFIDGYEQAEKDLELTWEDIKLVHNITYEESRNVSLNKGGVTSEKEFYKEVLKRFKEFKERKEK